MTLRTILDDYVIDRLFDAAGHGNNYYVRFQEFFGGTIWDKTNEVLSASTTWANSAIALVEDGENGSFPVVVPYQLPAGKRYTYTVYKRAGVSPANTDVVSLQSSFDKGDIYGF